MFDSLREQAGSDDSMTGQSALGGEPSLEFSAPTSPAAGTLLGMSPAQRLIIAVLLMITVCIVGTMCLMITGRIALI